MTYIADGNTGRQIATLENNLEYNERLLFISNDELIVEAGESNLGIWDAGTGQLLERLAAPGEIAGTRLSKDKRKLATLVRSQEGALAITEWDLSLETRSPEQVEEWVHRCVPLRIENGILRVDEPSSGDTVNR